MELNKREKNTIGRILYNIFKESDWKDLISTCYPNMDDYGDYEIFFRNLHWDNDPAESQCMEVFSELFDECGDAVVKYLQDHYLFESRLRTADVNIYKKFFDEEVADEEVADVEVDEEEMPNDIIRSALADVQLLISDNRPADAVDRIHTALHAFARQKCTDLGEDGERTLIADMSAISKYYRDNHNEDGAKILSSLNKFLDVLNDARNKRSLAHPNSSLMDNPESVLLINVAKSIMKYLNTLEN